MTNSALKAMIDELGDRICIIAFDNNMKVYIGYPSSTLQNVSDIQLKTFGDTDMVGIPKISNNPKASRLGIASVTWHPTACIQAIGVIDEGFEKYRIDPMEIG